MVNYVPIVGRHLIGLPNQSVRGVAIRFRQIWIWDRARCVQNARRANVNWIWYAVRAHTTMRHARQCCRSNMGGVRNTRVLWRVGVFGHCVMLIFTPI